MTGGLGSWVWAGRAGGLESPGWSARGRSQARAGFPLPHRLWLPRPSEQTRPRAGRRAGRLPSAPGRRNLGPGAGHEGEAQARTCPLPGPREPEADRDRARTPDRDRGAGLPVDTLVSPRRRSARPGRDAGRTWAERGRDARAAGVPPAASQPPIPQPPRPPGRPDQSASPGPPRSRITPPARPLALAAAVCPSVGICLALPSCLHPCLRPPLGGARCPGLAHPLGLPASVSLPEPPGRGPRSLRLLSPLTPRGPGPFVTSRPLSLCLGCGSRGLVPLASCCPVPVAVPHPSSPRSLRVPPPGRPPGLHLLSSPSLAPHRSPPSSVSRGPIPCVCLSPTLPADGPSLLPSCPPTP